MDKYTLVISGRDDSIDEVEFCSELGLDELREELRTNLTGRGEWLFIGKHNINVASLIGDAKNIYLEAGWVSENLDLPASITETA